MLSQFYNYEIQLVILILLFKYFQIMAQQAVNLDQFSPQEIYQLKQGFEGELNTLNQSMSQFRFAMDKY